ncbi:DEAD/DEAH box helicase [Algisphaera agarilytica]|uniref:SNF2 family DNA or RNA helicase n=1 Tax=Algisphaera agarilytica TaxID=1385975 RepID=A0A7X0H6I2_9BACT|nr:DEAD/DEAH box helicase [Algisphaera agarilytica]MBB6430144.1 SNF2 family DNA or RNA helicase [Algisphaera agarilytica]
MQGRALQLAGAVQRLKPTDDSGDDVLLRAEVKDNGEVHTVEITKEDKRYAVAECTCDDFAAGAFCRHIWAVLLDLNEHDTDDDHEGVTISDLARLRLRAPKARKRDDSARPVRSAEPQWIGRLSLLRPTSAENDAENSDAVSIFPTQRQVCYVILPELSNRHNGLVVDLQQRTAIASGWSKPKPLRVGLDTIDTLADKADRELVSMMLGATWVTQNEASQSYRLDRGHHTYRIAPGSQRMLLQRLIATGRCFVELDEDETNNRTNQRPLRWAGNDQPWKLWMVARQGAGELLVDLQLRRAGKRIAVTDPEIVLGGRDGLLVNTNPVEATTGKSGRSRFPYALAAPFDDRDAYRWVSQFRDHRYADDDAVAADEATEALDEPISASALRIPAEDVPRFLERLYLLPQLPELDLPEGMGREEQLLEPAPHLDLYSPGSAEAAELISGSGKSSLVARVWFDYAGQRVNPARKGRFVPVGPAKTGAAGASASTDPTAQPAVVGAAADAEDTATSGAPAEEEAQQSAVAVEDAEVADTESADVVENLDDASPDEKLIRRNLRSEREAIAATAGLGLRHTASPTGDVLLVSPKQMPRAVASLLAEGWIISADQKIVRAAGPPALSIASGIDWFELRGKVTYEQTDGTEQEFTLPEILAAARSGQNMITLGDGSQALLPEQWLDEHGLLTALGQIEGDHLRFKSSQAAMLDALLDEKDLVEIDDRFKQARERLKQFEGIKPLDPAPEFGGKLRSYQSEGLGWLAFLREFGMGGILADDMGLGKTVQVLAMIQGRTLGHADHIDPPLLLSDDDDKVAPTAKAKKKPSLIVVPRSVIFNWLDEAQKFCPELKVLAYSGPDRAAMLPKFDDYDLVVTSFGLMRRDIDKLKEKAFDYAVLDEAQAIKNPSSQSAKAARLLQANHRLALTGTPVENHLGDLWSIFEFLNPGMLGANARFSDLVRGASSNAAADKLNTPVNAEGQAQAVMADNGEGSPEDEDFYLPEEQKGDAKADTVAQVAAALRPFILRRTKTQVLDDLPAKTEQTIICEMEPAQRKVYDQMRKYYRGTLMKQLDDTPANKNSKGGEDASGNGVGKSAFMVLEALLRLRQAACHPALIDKEGIDSGDENTPSAKLDTLSEMLAEVIDGGQKALVFSQFTSMLSLVRKRLDELGIRYAYLDGQTRNRKQVVEQFQEDPDLQVFLISLKAGGVGLNLTAAEYVFILDPWWNPAVEAQAIDRTHRIGQTKPVFAYRMICEDTVEQRIIELQQRKRKLADAIVGGQQNLLQSLTREDIEQLLS